MRKISIFGLGRVGGALALSLATRGFEVVSVTGRDESRCRGVLDRIDPRPKFFRAGEYRCGDEDLILLTVRDDQIRDAVGELGSAGLKEGTVVLHTSGSRGSAILDPLREKGCDTGSIHPLVSISDPRLGSEKFRGVYFCVEGCPEAVNSAKEIASALGGLHFEVPSEKKPLYHASAVMACGHVVALLDEAIEALSLCGPDKAEAKEILMPLVASTIDNLRTQPPEKALTGTFARADHETFRTHLLAMESTVPEPLFELYLLLGRRSLELARRNGVDAGALAKIEDLIDEHSAR